MLRFIDDEKKREFIKAFNEYVNLERKKKRLSADNRIALTDFFNMTFTGLDTYSKKLKRKEYSKCNRTKEEVKRDEDPVQEVETIRVRHLEIPEESLEHYDSLIDDKLSSKREAERIKEQQEELVAVMRRSMIETDEVCNAVIKELVKEALGKVSVIDRVSSGVAEGKAVLFNKEAVGVEDD